jgi:hypothetical protein
MRQQQQRAAAGMALMYCIAAKSTLLLLKLKHRYVYQTLGSDTMWQVERSKQQLHNVPVQHWQYLRAAVRYAGNNGIGHAQHQQAVSPHSLLPCVPLRAAVLQPVVVRSAGIHWSIHAACCLHGQQGLS